LYEHHDRVLWAIKRYSQALEDDGGVIVLRTGVVEVVEGFTGTTEDDVTARTCELVEVFAATGATEVEVA
jgi:hypothetical protein